MLLGGNDDAYPLQEFLDLTVEAFLCIRKHWRDICNVINCMSDSGLPCFLPDTLVNLKKRFGPEESELVAARNMLTRVSFRALIYYSQKIPLRNGQPFSMMASKFCKTAFIRMLGKLVNCLF